MKYSWLLAALKGTSWSKKLSLAKKYLFDRKNIDPITKCALCPNNCRFSCPVALVDAKETTSPSGRSRIAFLLKNDYLEWKEDTVYPLFYCLGCELCKLHCAFELSHVELYAELRRKAIKLGVAPNGVMNYVSKFNVKHISYESHDKNKGVLVYWGQELGAPQRDRNVVIRLLEKIGYEAYGLSEEIVLDTKPYMLGLKEKATELSRKVYELIGKAKLVVTPSARTYYFLKVIIPKTINKRVNVKHIVELLLEKKDKLKPKQEQYALHENPLLVSLGNNTIQESLRELGLNFVLPWRNGATTLPCPDKGNLIWLVDPKLGEKICYERINELKQLERKVLVLTIEDKDSLEQDIEIEIIYNALTAL